MITIPKKGWIKIKPEDVEDFSPPVGSLVKCNINGKDTILLIGNAKSTGYGGCGCCESSFTEAVLYEWHPFISELFSRVWEEIYKGGSKIK
jgi:hypothetical protein